jgi:hypothetical protein
MDRKEFFNKSCKCGIASLFGLIFIQNDSFAQSSDKLTLKEVEKIESNMDFAQQRFSDLLIHLENYIGNETRVKLYKDLGESCASAYVEQLTPLKGNLKMMLDEQLKQDWLKEYNLNESAGVLKLIGKPKGKCGCPLVQKGLTPKEFCNCSIGHIKKIYEVVTGKKIEVELDDSILMGNEQCSFTVRIFN